LKIADFENLFVNNADLVKLESAINRFNPLKVLRIEQMEIRHSSILGWLLNPYENHGLGDDFLKSFLSEALKSWSERGGETKMSSIDVYSANLTDAEVLIEWNNIDLLIRCPGQGWVFVVENKLRSKQRKGQLTDYREFLEAEILRGGNHQGTENRRREVLQGILLTLDGEEAQDDAFLEFTYERVLECVKICRNRRAGMLSSQINDFIEYYEKTLEELVSQQDNNDPIKRMAKQLYREHREVIDFIVEHGSATEFQHAVSQLTKEGVDLSFGDEFQIHGHEITYLREWKTALKFIPTRWANALGRIEGLGTKSTDPSWQGIEKWDVPYPVAVVLYLRETRESSSEARIRIKVEVGPLSNHVERVSLVESIEDQSEGFRGSDSSQKIQFGKNAKEEKAKYSTFYSISKGRSIKDVHNAEQIKTAIEAAIKEIVPLIEPIEVALQNFMRDR